jgi:hypothetical protein
VTQRHDSNPTLGAVSSRRRGAPRLTHFRKVPGLCGATGNLPGTWPRAPPAREPDLLPTAPGEVPLSWLPHPISSSSLPGLVRARDVRSPPPPPSAPRSPPRAHPPRLRGEPLSPPCQRPRPPSGHARHEQCLELPQTNTCPAWAPRDLGRTHRHQGGAFSRGLGNFPRLVLCLSGVVEGGRKEV